MVCFDLLNWNGLTWDFERFGISIMERRVRKCFSLITEIQNKWPMATFRDISRLVGIISSMHPVLEEQCQLRSRFLQMQINLKHFKLYSWEKRIHDQPKLILDQALGETKFWQMYLNQLNFRPFRNPPPSVVGWVDASGLAAGGIACRIVNEAVGKYRPLTADNLLLPVTAQTGLAAVKNCAQWQVASVQQSLNQRRSCIRDEYDLDPRLISDVAVTHKKFSLDEIA